jgi:CBS domain-containing protein
MDTTLRARDLMERDIITVSPETPILDVHRLFVEEEIHGAPVVGEDGIVYGVVSALDLLRAVREDEEVCESTAADAMTKTLVMVAPDASIEEVARTMREQRIHRVLVGEHRVLEGVLTTFDLLRVLSPR